MLVARSLLPITTRGRRDHETFPIGRVMTVEMTAPDLRNASINRASIWDHPTNFSMCIIGSLCGYLLIVDLGFLQFAAVVGIDDFPLGEDVQPGDASFA